LHAVPATPSPAHAQQQQQQQQQPNVCSSGICTIPNSATSVTKMK
jgi:hypothetical protein